jgi:hypothetical protein
LAFKGLLIVFSTHVGFVGELLNEEVEKFCFTFQEISKIKGVNSPEQAQSNEIIFEVPDIGVFDLQIIQNAE